MSTSTTSSSAIVFITGAFVSHACWDNWSAFFESKGYTTLTPPWPAKNADAVTLRSRHPDKKLASLTTEELINYYEAIITSLPQKPILIGHSFGGLLVQIFLNRGLAAAGVAIHSVTPVGIVPLEFSFLKSNALSLGFFTSLDKPYLRSFASWQYAFTNQMAYRDQVESYERFAIPESKRVIRGALTKAAYVDFSKKTEPLLMLAGSIDHCIPPSLSRRNYNKYKDKESMIEFVIREGRNHFVLGQPSWKEDADYILQWLRKNTVGSAIASGHSSSVY